MKIKLLFLTLSFSVLILLSYIKLFHINYLYFSDAAKFADIAKNTVDGYGFKTNFVNPGNNLFEVIKSLPVYQPWIPPLMPLSLAIFFKIFGTSDFSVMLTSSFYYLLFLTVLFLIAQKIFGKLVAILTTIAVSANINYLDYALSGGSETIFVFEIILSLFLISIRKKYSDLCALLVLILMYFTRPQAFIYILGSVIFFLLSRFQLKKAIIYFVGVLILGILIDRTILSYFNGQHFLYSITSRGSSAFSDIAIAQSPSEMLRGGSVPIAFNFLLLAKKIFYNLYNFYKLMPQIMNPYLWGLFVISVFVWGKDKFINSLKISAIVMVGMTLLVSAASIPFFRYNHPIIPLVYLFAVEILVLTLRQFYNFRLKDRKQISFHTLKITKQNFVILCSLLLILLLVVGQSFGVIFLDSRFENKSKNVGKPPIYARLSWVLKDNTSKDDVIITNLDTWGSWYGERKTVWFPLQPKQLIDKETGKIPFDAIYLTNYLIDDENYLMGDEWKQILFNPDKPESWVCDGCDEIKNEFELGGKYFVGSKENFQNIEGSAVLLVRRDK